MREAQVGRRRAWPRRHESEIRRPEDIAPAVEALQGHADALYACNGSLVTTNRVRIGELALGARFPTMFCGLNTSKRVV